MNERINQFIKQSYVTVQSPSGEGYTSFSQEKFAELIVQDCIQRISHLMDYTDYNDTEKSMVELKTLRDARQVIKEHFGVEE